MSRRSARLGLSVSVLTLAAVLVAPAAYAAPPTTPDRPTYDRFPAVADPGLGAPGYFSPYWFDDTGTHIQAHGGQIVTGQENGEPVYYWYGEDRSNDYYNSPGVHVYKSYDALNWTDEGLALKAVTERDQLMTPEFDAVYDTVDDNGTVDQAKVDDLFYHLNSRATEADGTRRLNAIFERPKVLYNDSTQQWVMWWHSDGSIEPGGSNYARSLAAVAVSDSPTGPFKLTGSFRLYNETSYRTACNMPSAVPGQARDMTVYKDDDGSAYVVYSSEENRSLYIAKLNAEYTNVDKTTTEDPIGFQYSESGQYPKIFADGTAGAPVSGQDFTIVKRCGVLEAPAVFEHDGRYNVVASGATGWNPNPTTYYTADSLLGTWTRGVEKGDPYENVAYNRIPEGGDGLLAVGDRRGTTFGSQPTNVLPVNAEKGEFVYMGDRWNEGAANSTYVWLPIVIGENGRLEMRNPAVEDPDKWGSGWTEEYWNTHGAGKYLWNVTDAKLPAKVRANTDITAQLPKTVTVRANGVDRETAVTWPTTSFSSTGQQRVTGVLAGDSDFTPGRTFSRMIDVEAYGAVNIAPQATVTASSRQDLAPTVIDGSTGKGWDDWVGGGNYPKNSSLAFRWSEARVLDSVTVTTYKDGSTATWPSRIGVSYRAGDGDWTTSSVNAAVEQNASASAPVVKLDVSALPPTTELRLDLSTSTSTWQSISEVQIAGYTANSDTQLTGLTAGGVSVPGFSPSVTDYTIGGAPATVAATAASGRDVEVVQATADDRTALVTVSATDGGKTVAARVYRISFTDTSGACPAVQSPWRSTAFGTAAANFCQTGAGAFSISDAGTGAWTDKDNLSVIGQVDVVAAGSAIETTVSTFDRGSNSDARAGLVVRNDLSSAGKASAKGYAVLTTSPTGVFLQVDTDGNGYIDTETAKVTTLSGAVQLKLERTDATTVTGFARAASGDAWTRVGAVTLNGADTTLDAGVFATANNGAGAAKAAFVNTRVTTPPSVTWAATTATRCVAVKVVLAVTVRNTGATAADYSIVTPYGSATAKVEAGKSVSKSFSTRVASVGAGSVEVTGTADGQTATRSAAFAGATC